MILYYCTICALYPCFYAKNLNSSPGSLASETFEQAYGSANSLANIDSKPSSIASKLNLLFYATEDEFEATSEGLCDFVREIFSLDRQVFNDYQVRALKKLLLKKSHAQVRNIISNKNYDSYDL